MPNEHARMKPLNFIRIRKQECPACGLKLNGASDPLNDNAPSPGDLTLCAGCKTMLSFGEAMDLRLATQAEINKVEIELGMVNKDFLQKTYSLLNTPQGPAILCHACGKTSFNKNDINNRYCKHCYTFLK